MLVKVLCCAAGKASGGEVVKPAETAPRAAYVSPEVFDEGASLSVLRAEGALIDAKVHHLLARTDKQIKRLEARNARQMANLMQQCDAQADQMGRLHARLSDGLARITNQPGQAAQADELMQQLQDAIDLQCRRG